MSSTASVVVGDFGAARRRATQLEKMNRLGEIKNMTENDRYVVLPSSEEPWVTATMEAIKSGDLSWEIQSFAVGSITKSGSHGVASKSMTTHKKVVDLYSAFMFMRPVLMSNPTMAALEGPDGSFNVDEAEKIASRLSIAKFFKEIPIDKPDQLFFFFSFVDKDTYAVKPKIRDKMRRFTVKMYKWFSRNGRHLSRAKSYSESIEEQQERLAKSCFALLCAGGSGSQATQLLRSRFGHNYECNMHNDKRRIERVMGIKGQEAEDFWKW
jgi:hypothetical protein